MRSDSISPLHTRMGTSGEMSDNPIGFSGSDENYPTNCSDSLSSLCVIRSRILPASGFCDPPPPPPPPPRISSSSPTRPTRDLLPVSRILLPTIPDSPTLPPHTEVENMSLDDLIFTDIQPQSQSQLHPHEPGVRLALRF